MYLLEGEKKREVRLCLGNCVLCLDQLLGQFTR